MKFTMKQGLLVACMMSLINLGALANNSNQKEDSIKSVVLTQYDTELVFSSTTSGSVFLTADEMRDTKGAGKFCWPGKDGTTMCVVW